MFDLSIVLQNMRRNIEEKNVRIAKPKHDRRKYITFEKDGDICLKANSNFVNHSLKCSYCMQSGHLRNYCYLRYNMRLGMKTKWIQINETNINGPNRKWVPKVMN